MGRLSCRWADTCFAVIRFSEGWSKAIERWKVWSCVLKSRKEWERESCQVFLWRVCSIFRAVLSDGCFCSIQQHRDTKDLHLKRFKHTQTCKAITWLQKTWNIVYRLVVPLGFYTVTNVMWWRNITKHSLSSSYLQHSTVEWKWFLRRCISVLLICP